MEAIEQQEPKKKLLITYRCSVCGWEIEVNIMSESPQGLAQGIHDENKKHCRGMMERTY